MDTGNLNLQPHRGRSIWDDRSWNRPAGHLHVGRWLVGAGGGALLAYSLTRPSSKTKALSAAGGVLALGAATGRLNLNQPRGWIDRLWPRRKDSISEVSDHSFPASDAPSWTPTTGTGAPGR